ncbi:hypothetical protein [Candidatus Amarobacter glycogenicus]|uniref:hypothetical protein n=1 Tax=Candidatus Amarobacter glycogenicus TaxID=3140699 RepID=UPI0031CC8473
MQLRRLAALERNALLSEYEELIKKIAELEDLLANPRKIDFVVRDDIIDLKKKRRRPPHRNSRSRPQDFREEDLSPPDSVINPQHPQLHQAHAPRRVPAAPRRSVALRAPPPAKKTPSRPVVCDTHDNLLLHRQGQGLPHSAATTFRIRKKQAKGLPSSTPSEIERTARSRHRHPRRQGLQPRLHPLATREGAKPEDPPQGVRRYRRNGKIAMDLEPTDQLICQPHGRRKHAGHPLNPAKVRQSCSEDR